MASADVNPELDGQFQKGLLLEPAIRDVSEVGLYICYERSMKGFKGLPRLQKTRSS